MKTELNARNHNNMVKTFDQANQERIHAIEMSFGAAGKPLSLPGRVLIGQGCLLKQSRRGPQPKVFFLFDDLLVYGSIILRGRWHKKQKIIPIEDTQLEDLEDGVTMKNQWLIRTPRKSFYVAAASYEEKRTWMEHIDQSRLKQLQNGGRRPGSTFAVTWIPDRATAVCMRCPNRFTVTFRKHHCRKCGFVVCGTCSDKRVVVPHIHPTKRLRVCGLCYRSLAGTEEEAEPTESCGSVEKTSLGDDGTEESSEEEEDAVEPMEELDPSGWVDPLMEPWSTYVYLKPEHARPTISKSQ